ncbi:hypothetical protein BaRGS_00037224, partial [Batillaria attramentaria]
SNGIDVIHAKTVSATTTAKLKFRADGGGVRQKALLSSVCNLFKLILETVVIQVDMIAAGKQEVQLWGSTIKQETFAEYNSSFVVTGVGATLTVSIHSVRGESLTLWTYTATYFNDSSVWNEASLLVRSCSAFKTPDGADEGEETGDDVAAIVGSVVAVAVIIIILVVVGVVLWRRRRRDKDGSASDAGHVMAGRDADLPKDGAQISSLEETFDSGYSQVDPLPPSFNRVDGLAEDGEPRKRRRSNVTDEYNVLNAHGSRKNAQQPQDDYSHIQSQDFGPDASAMYSQVKKPENNASTGFDAGVLYSQVQKKGKKPAGPQSATCGDDYNRIDFSAGAVGAPDGSRDTYNRLDKTT